MSKSRTIGIAAVCAAVGAAGGIAGTAASTSKHHGRHAGRQTSTTPRPGHPPFGDHRGFGPRPVHVEAVVLDKAGKSWITVTEDNGTVKSVDGDKVTIAEGTTDVPYATPALTIPSDATVVRDGAKATVGDLKAGDDIHVTSSSDGTFVFAADSSWRPQGPWGDRDGDHHGPPPGAAGPPPGAPAPPSGSNQ